MTTIIKTLFFSGLMICYIISMKQFYEFGFWTGALRAADALDDEADDRPFHEKLGGPSPWREWFPGPDEGRDRPTH
jgi:hypothetical protein